MFTQTLRADGIYIRPTRGELEPKCVPQCHLGSYLGTRWFNALVSCWPRRFARWLHLTTTTRILQGFVFLYKLGLLLCKPLWDYQTKYERKNDMDSASSSKMTPSHARLAFLCNIILNIPEIFLMLMILPLVWRYQICIASFLYSYRDNLTENLE